MASANTAQLTSNQILQINDQFLLSALRKNALQPTKPIARAGQVIDFELEEVPGWANSLIVTVNADLATNVATGGTAPRWSKFFPQNFFESVQLSLGGGPFQDVSPVLYDLREQVMSPSLWTPGASDTATSYAQNSFWNVPSQPTATAGSTEDTQLKWAFEIPLQVQHGSIAGHIPLGDSTVVCKVRFRIAQDLYGSDEWLNPVVGGTSVTSVTIGSTYTSSIGMDINYRTTPATPGTFQPPIVGQVLSLQMQSVSITSTGQNIPISFKDPFYYLRLWLICIDGTGTPNSKMLNNLELDLTPKYPQWAYDTDDGFQSYFYQINKRYKKNLPDGVFVFDLWSGSDPANPNGEQMIDGSKFSTLRGQVKVAQGTTLGDSAKVIAISEALTGVDF